MRAVQWEYVTREWSFYGPVDDDWPLAVEYRRLMDEQKARKEAEEARSLMPVLATFDPDDYDVLDGPLGDGFRREYLSWRVAEEQAYLNEFGVAGFELVALSRNQGPMNRTFATIEVAAYFKRPLTEDAPPAPDRQIGFQPRSGWGSSTVASGPVRPARTVRGADEPGGQ